VGKGEKRTRPTTLKGEEEEGGPPSSRKKEKGEYSFDSLGPQGETRKGEKRKGKRKRENPLPEEK